MTDDPPHSLSGRPPHPNPGPHFLIPVQPPAPLPPRPIRVEAPLPLGLRRRRAWGKGRERRPRSIKHRVHAGDGSLCRVRGSRVVQRGTRENFRDETRKKFDERASKQPP